MKKQFKLLKPILLTAFLLSLTACSSDVEQADIIDRLNDVDVSDKNLDNLLKQYSNNSNISANDRNLFLEMLEGEDISFLARFAFDVHAIDPQYFEKLDKLAMALNKVSNIKLTLEGHTDSLGTTSYNLGLGQRRAEAVKNYLISQGINKDRIIVVSYGKEKPLFDDESSISRAKNRRVEFKI